MIVQNSWTLDSLVDAYKQHQRRVRGLRERTLHGYEQLIRVVGEPTSGSARLPRCSTALIAGCAVD
jgi:hypothetical protein